MSRHGSVLPIPDPRPARIQNLVDAWPELERMVMQAGGHPRAVWLAQMEWLLRRFVPGSYSSRDYNLTARSLAPFPLEEHDWL